MPEEEGFEFDELDWSEVLLKLDLNLVVPGPVTPSFPPVLASLRACREPFRAVHPSLVLKSSFEEKRDAVFSSRLEYESAVF